MSRINSNSLLTFFFSIGCHFEHTIRMLVALHKESSVRKALVYKVVFISSSEDFTWLDFKKIRIYKKDSGMRSYNSYHTFIKQLAKSNTLPQRYIASIDRSTIWRWKDK